MMICGRALGVLVFYVLDHVILGLYARYTSLRIFFVFLFLVESVVTFGVVLYRNQ